MMGSLRSIIWFHVTLFIVYSIAADSNKIDQFRAFMRDKIPKSSNLSLLIDDDLYVANWLKMGSGNLESAKTLFRQHLSWREFEKIDTMHTEDWSIMSEDYPIFVDTWDKSGRPATESMHSDWDMRRAIVTGQGKKLIRWQIYNQEKMQNRLYETRRLGNKNVTGISTIVDCQGMNVLKQLCVACQKVFTTMGEISQTNYFYLLERTYMVNMGPAIHAFTKAVHPLYNKPGFPNKFIFLYHRFEWMPVLNRNYDANQRSVRFGGTKKRN